MKLCRTIVFAKDLPRMLAFYRDAFGLRVIPETVEEGWAELDAGGVSLALHAIPPQIAERIQISDPPAARSETPIKLVFEADDLVAARAHLTALGAAMTEIRDANTCDGLDPEGNVLQLVQKLIEVSSR